ncbi:MAG: glycosyltransferase [Oligoflexales bacterium]
MTKSIRNPQLRIDQILPTFCQHDAIGNEVRWLRKLLFQMNIDNRVYAERGDIQKSTGVYPIEDYPQHQHNRFATIHHFSTGSNVPHWLLYGTTRIITRNHNITPPAFFHASSDHTAYNLCHQGYRQRDLVDRLTHNYWHDSEFNIELFKNSSKHHHVLPILRHYKHLTELHSDQNLIQKLQTGHIKNILFVGRFAPNKKTHDLILALKALHNFVNKDIRLILVGSPHTLYGQQTLQIAKELDLKISDLNQEHLGDIVIPGQVNDETLASIYHACDLFLCMSEHEGFCVPLLEALTFNIPVMAHSCTAIPGTLKDGGILFNKQHPEIYIPQIKNALYDRKVRDNLKAQAQKRAQDFSWGSLQTLFQSKIEQIFEDTQYS